MSRIQKAVIYARYSPGPNQREESIEGQVRECTEFAENGGYAVVGIYVDRAVSGRSDDRADFQRMLRDVEKRQFEAIVVWKIDRFGRNREEIAVNKIKCKKNGVKVLYAKENIPEGPTGIILESLLEGMAEYYSAELSEKIIRGMTENALKGMVTNGAPLGYLVGEDKRFIVDDSTAPTVQRVFELYDTGSNLAEIINEMNELGLRTKRGAPFNKNSLGKMLRNEKYVGIYRWRDIVNEEAIPPIIDRDVFDRVQERLGERARAGGRRAKMDYLLATKIFCGRCGKNMQGESGTGKLGGKFYYYICTSRKRKGGCRKPPIKKHWIEHLVTSMIVENVLYNEEAIARIADDCVKLQTEEQKTTVLYTLEEQLASVEVSIKNLLRLAERGTLTDSTHERLSELENEKQELKLHVARESIGRVEVTREQVVEWLHQLRDGDVCNPEYQKKIIDTFVNSVFIYDDKIRIVYNCVADNDTMTLLDIEGEVSPETAQTEEGEGFDNSLLPSTSENSILIL